MRDTVELQSHQATSDAAVRVRSLDGLRGLAAITVVASHALMVVPAMALTIRTPPSDVASVQWWLYHTPLNLLWAGQQAVLVFFVLSGFVLAELVSRSSTRNGWMRGFYAQRFVRLYLPVWGAVGLAALLAVAVPREMTALI